MAIQRFMAHADVGSGSTAGACAPGPI